MHKSNNIYAGAEVGAKIWKTNGAGAEIKWFRLRNTLVLLLVLAKYQICTWIILSAHFHEMNYSATNPVVINSV